MNNVCLSGRPTKDPEFRTTTSGKSVCSFTIACDGRIKNADGTYPTSFIGCVCFGKGAETMAKLVRKGSLIEIEGFLNQRKYQRKDGSTASVIEVMIDRFHLLGKKPTHDEIPPFDDAPAIKEDSRNLDSIDLPEDDLPF